MNRRRTIGYLVQLFTVAVLAPLFVNCSTATKAISSGDPQLMFSVAKDYYQREEWEQAIKLFESALPYYKGTSKEDSIQFFNARCYYKAKRYQLAGMKLDEYRRSFSRSPFIEDAEGMYAMSYYYLSPSPKRDNSITNMAIMAIEEFQSRYPTSSQIETFDTVKAELVGRLHEKSFVNAYTYYKIGRYKSAIVAFKNAMKEFPDSELREKLSYYVVASGFELADNSIEDKKEDRFLSMKDSYYTFIAEFPDSEYREEMDQMLTEADKYLEYQNKIRIAEANGITIEAMNSLNRKEARLLKKEKKARGNRIDIVGRGASTSSKSTTEDEK